MQNPKILLMDSRKTSCFLITRVLHNEEFKDIITVNDEKSLLQNIKENKTNLILMDMQTPKLNMFEVVKKIRQLSNCKNVPIIGLSTDSNLEHKENCINSGINTVLIKPFKEEDLIRKVKFYLSLS